MVLVIIYHMENFIVKNMFLKILYKYLKKPYFDGTWAILAVKLIMTLLWGLLLIVPGIIKWISYSQALFIYKETLDRVLNMLVQWNAYVKAKA